MWMRFVKETFGLENHPRIARVMAVVMPVVLIVGAVVVFMKF